MTTASALGAKIGVLHLWDTYTKSLDIEKLFGKVHEVSNRIGLGRSCPSFLLNAETG